MSLTSALPQRSRRRHIPSVTTSLAEVAALEAAAEMRGREREAVPVCVWGSVKKSAEMDKQLRK